EASPGRQGAARWAPASGLGYEALRDANVSLATKIRGRRLLRRIRWSCPPWIGAGRYLDVGCGSGGSLGVARALGWRVAGIEMDDAAAAKARRFTDELHVGDVLTAPFAPRRFDAGTAFPLLAHVPGPTPPSPRMPARP